MRRINIDGKAVPLYRVDVRHMNFGQHWRTQGVDELPYSLALPAFYLRNALEEALEGIVDDARKFPEDDGELDSALRRRNWPSLCQILDDLNLRQLALECLSLEVLQLSIHKYLVLRGFEWVAR